MKAPLRILLIEDNYRDAELIEAELKAAELDYSILRVDTLECLAKELETGNIDIFLSDMLLPGFTGKDALEMVRKKCPEVPFILVSGTIGEENAVDMLKRGATDYILKARLFRLASAICRAVKEADERRERSRLERQFIEAQKMEVLGHLASGMAHDFNNILNVIVGHSDLIKQKIEATSPLHESLEQINHAAERATTLTSQLLVFCRKQVLQPIVLDINEVLRDLEKMLKPLIDENIVLALELGKDVGRVKVDSGSIGQVLMNLVINARDAMPNGGRLNIKTYGAVLDDNYVFSHPGTASGEYVVLAIHDTGVGMSDEIKARLFEAFFTTKPKGKGTGLGLVTCQTIVRQCGGHIDVRSDVGKGTTFEIYFPRINQPMAASRRSELPGQVPRGTETVLLVEDEPSVRHLASDFLKSLGYRVLRASNGEEGLQLAREFPDQMSLVVTDIVMPKMGGKVMAEWLRADYPHLKILFTSGYTDESVFSYGMSGPDIAFLPKPYTPSAMARKVRELLDSSVPH